MDEEDIKQPPFVLPIYGMFEMASLLADRDSLRSALMVKESGIRLYDTPEQESDMSCCESGGE